MLKKMTLAVAAIAIALSAQAAFAADDRPAPRDRQGDEIRRPMGPDGAWRGGPHGRRGDGPGPGRHFGKGPGRHFDMGPGMMAFGHRFMDELELTDAQKTQLVDVMTARFREGMLVRMEMADAGRKLRDLTESESPDKDAIIAANEAMGTAKGKMEALFLTAKDEVRKILTPEQQTKLDEMFDRRRGDREDDDGPRGDHPRMPRHGGRGPGPRWGGCN